jgi:hypothetical protein
MNFGAKPTNAIAWRVSCAEQKRAHGAAWLNDGSRVQNRQTASTRPCNSENRTDRSPIDDPRMRGLKSPRKFAATIRFRPATQTRRFYSCDPPNTSTHSLPIFISKSRSLADVNSLTKPSSFGRNCACSTPKINSKTLLKPCSRHNFKVAESTIGNNALSDNQAIPATTRPLS